MERATKLLVVAWAAAALAAELWLLRGWGLTWLAAGAFGGALILVAIDRRAIGAVLVFTYIFPAVIRLIRGFYVGQFSAIWMAMLLGALIVDALRTPWHVPVRWRGALVCWALVVCAGVPIVIGREIDFNPVLLFEPRMEWSSLGVMPQAVVSFVIHVGLVLVLGILWIDWLFGQKALDFRRSVAMPLLVSSLLMAAVAVYQLFFGVTFLNETVYGNIGRASGTVYDANVCGTMAALWIGGAVLWGAPSAGPSGRRQLMVLSLMIAALWLAVWATGSRTSFAAALIVSGFSLFALYRERGEAGGWRLTAPRAAALAGALIVVLAILASADLGVVGPVRRVWDSLPGNSPASPPTWGAFALELWNRNRYGVAAGAMIRDFPWVGVGVGTFHHIAPDFITDVALPPDNAQNWYRHQLTEFGVIGSLGWIAWLVAFAAFVVWRPSHSPPVAWAGRGMLVAFAAISLVGMPAQEIIATVTFWTAVYWFCSLTPPEVGRVLLDPASHNRLSKWSWTAIAVVVIVYTAGTVTLARGRLRVPIRALETGKPYSYGFYYPEPDPRGGEYRWARRRAAIVLEAPTSWLALRLWVNHRDVGANPVDVKVWRDGVRVVNTTLTTNDPITQFIHIPGGPRRILLETLVSRIVAPVKSDIEDRREFGLQVNWTFVDKP
jgi:hypothetical protein